MDVDVESVVDANDQGTQILADGTGLISLRILKASLEALPANYDPAAHRRFAWDLRVTYVDGFSEVFLYGPFYLYPGVVRDA